MTFDQIFSKTILCILHIANKCISQKHPKYGFALYLEDKIAEHIDTMTKTDVEKKRKEPKNTMTPTETTAMFVGMSRAVFGHGYFKET